MAQTYETIINKLRQLQQVDINAAEQYGSKNSNNYFAYKIIESYLNSLNGTSLKIQEKENLLTFIKNFSLDNATIQESTAYLSMIQHAARRVFNGKFGFSGPSETSKIFNSVDDNFLSDVLEYICSSNEDIQYNDNGNDSGPAAAAGGSTPPAPYLNLKGKTESQIDSETRKKEEEERLKRDEEYESNMRRLEIINKLIKKLEAIEETKIKQSEKNKQSETLGHPAQTQQTMPKLSRQEKNLAIAAKRAKAKAEAEAEAKAKALAKKANRPRFNTR